MSWYADTRGLDLSKPIFSKLCEDDDIVVLLPQLDTMAGGYTVIGYNWFNLTSGYYNSCILFETVEEAIRARGIGICYNGELVLK